MQQTSYFESKVLTAAPSRLHLMLIEGAIRFGRQAEIAMKGKDPSAAGAPLSRLIDIVGEMLAGVREKKTELNQRLTSVYWFVFRRISEAKINSDAGALAEALTILEYERQTWLLVCEKFGGAANATASSVPHSRSADSKATRGAGAGVSWQA